MIVVYIVGVSHFYIVYNKLTQMMTNNSKTVNLNAHRNTNRGIVLYLLYDNLLIVFERNLYCATASGSAMICVNKFVIVFYSMKLE